MVELKGAVIEFPANGRKVRGYLSKPESGAGPGVLVTFLYYAVQINLLLAFFNLIPVPPLDGGNVLLGLLPPSLAAVLDQVRGFGFLILYALMLTGVATALILPPTHFFMRVLLP